ncbi:EAL domain-containing protein [Marinobacteraceae bacterium S3BR75-40.1]
MADDNNDDELVEFIDEPSEEDAAVQTAAEAWSILIVDDEEQVHRATRFALESCRILGRPLAFTSAYSAAEARTLLGSGAEFACVLLDVVMESEHAGLGLVSYIRETLDNDRTRIVLRTGQPGYAPEVEVIQKYDINDYKAKSELTSNRLITTLTAAIRSYEQIRTIEENRRGLELIIDGGTNLFKERAVKTFSRGVLMQLCSLLHIEQNGFLCCHYENLPLDRLKVLAASGAYEKYTGAGLESLDNETVRADIQRVFEQKESIVEAERVVLYSVSPNGDELVIHVSSRQPLSEVDIRLLELFAVNIAVGFDNASMFERLEHLAYSDPLTGLPNRNSLPRNLEPFIEAQAPFALVLVDIDNFQAVSDGLGHAVGDQTLMQVAQRLSDHFGEQCCLTRISGDSFCLVIPGDDRAGIDAQLNALQQSFRDGFTVEGHEIPLTLTVGVALFPQHGNNAETLAQNASIALKQAKRTQRASHCFFDPDYERDLLKRLRIANELRTCVEKRCLELHYQPQMSLGSRRIVGAEALVRWRREDQRLVSPADFIPIAESSGHIVSMGAWILEEACRKQLVWVHETGKHIDVAVNVSLRQLKDDDFFNILDDVLARTSIDPRHLELEITETMMMADTELLRDLLQAIRQRGVKIAVDDFGTGYSSLSYLQQLPVDRLKIDRSFIEGLHQRSEDQVIAALVVEMGHLLNLNVIAEGVENKAQEAQLIKLGCDDVQGFYYAKPQAHEAFVRLLEQFSAPD